MSRQVFADDKDKETREREAKERVKGYSYYFVAIIIILSAVFVYMILNAFNNSQKSISDTMPDLYEKTYSESVEILHNENGYDSENIDRFPRDSQSYWTVCGQYPVSGEKLDTNEVIVYLDNGECEK